MAKLTGDEIARQVASGRIVIDPFRPENVGPNSVDLTLGSTILEYDFGTRTELDMRVENPCTTSYIHEYGFVLQPGKLYLGVTNECAGSDYFIPCIEGRSSVARLGLFVHITAGFGDLGFKGHWTLELMTIHPLTIYPNVRICQVFFDTTHGSRTIQYDKEHYGKYGAQDGPNPIASKLYKDFE